MIKFIHATLGPVVKLVYTQDLKSCDSNVVWVRVPPGPLVDCRCDIGKTIMPEKCIHPYREQASGGKATCPSAFKKTYKDVGTCGGCPKITQERVVASDFMSGLERINSDTASDLYRKRVRPKLQRRRGYLFEE